MKFRDEVRHTATPFEFFNSLYPQAQSALEASFNAGWVDDTLAQAAWVNKNMYFSSRLPTKFLRS